MGTRKEEKILEEIQKRVFEEDEKLAQQKEDESLQEATFEVLKENTSLSDASIEKIAKEVRSEINRKHRIIAYSLISVFIFAIFVSFFILTGNNIKPRRVNQSQKYAKSSKAQKKQIVKKKIKPTKKAIEKNVLTRINTATKNLNSLIKVSNIIVLDINKSFLCISKFWDSVQYSRKGMRLRRRYECVINYDENLMKKSMQNLKSAGLYTPSIENSAEQYNIKIKELVRKYNELILYQRKKTYLQDNFKGAKTIISNIIEVSDEIKKVKSDFVKSIDDTYKEVVADYLTQKQYPRLNEYITNEISLIKKWSYNLSKGVWTNSIPYDAIYDNYMKYGFLDEKEFYQGLQIDRYMKRNYQYVLKNVKSRNSRKKSVIDRRNLYYWNNDLFANESYQKLHPYYLIKAYNYFADRSISAKQPLLKRHLLIWDLSLNDKKGKYPFKKYSKIEKVNSKKIESAVKNSSITPELFKTLDLVIKYINSDLCRRSQDLIYATNSYIRNVDKQREVKSSRRRRRRRPATINISRIQPISQTDYEVILHKLKKESVNGEIVNQFESVKNLSDEIYHKASIIGLKSKEDINFIKKNDTKVLLKEINSLIKKLEKQKVVLVTNIALFYEGFKVDYNNPFIATASKFSQVLDIASKYFYKKSAEKNVLKDLKREHNYLVEKQFELLEGVPRGKRRYSSPYYKYERFNKSLQVFCNSIESKKDKELILKRYNSMVSYYNEFAALSINKSMVLGRDMIITSIN
jgi:hypothetical protein